MRSLFIAAVLTVICAADISAQNGNIKKISSVVKVFSVNSKPSYYQPWRNYSDSSATGSGAIIAGNRILTNAHIVANQTFLQVRKQGDQKKYIARLETVGHECDLALLKVDDPSFFKGLAPLELGNLPKLQEKVNVLGYPIGGDNISVTEGVVSRIEPVKYHHSGRELLAVQIDAAINPGNSGGPVVEDGKMVGIAFQGLSQSQSIGYMIPIPVIEHFLKDVEDKKYDGFPEFSVFVVNLENPDMRKWLKMEDDDTGVLITNVPLPEKEKNVLMEDDVILEVDGIKIANDATIPFRDNEVIFFESLFWDKYIGQTCKLKILRNGKKMVVEYPLTAAEKLVPERTFDKLPTYYLLGGMLFVPLTINYLDSWNNWWTNAPRELVNYAAFGQIKKDKDEVVVLAQMMADETNVGYQNLRYRAIKKINGKKVRSLEEFIKEIESMKSGFLELKLEGFAKIVLDINQCREATARVMRRYRIPKDRSQDLLSK